MFITSFAEISVPWHLRAQWNTASLRKAHAMLKMERGLPTMAAAPSSYDDRAILQLALLTPDIQQIILAGRQPSHVNFDAFRKIGLPLLWAEQRKALRFKDPSIPRN